MNRKIALLLLSLIIINPIYTCLSQPSEMGVSSICNYIWQNPKYCMGIAVLGGISLIPLYLYFKKLFEKRCLNKVHDPVNPVSDEQVVEVELNKIKEYQLGKQQNLPQESLQILYKIFGSPLLLSIPKDELNNAVELKNLFEEYQIITGRNRFTKELSREWDGWSEALSVLEKRADNKEGPPNSFSPKIDLHGLPVLLQDAKAILKSFIIPTIPDSLSQQFIKKDGLGRLFTYAKLQQVIKEEQLSHIHLPVKMLVIEDLETHAYLTGQEAEKVVDDLIKIFSFDSSLEIKLDLDFSTKYKMHVFAHKQQKPNHNQFSPTTQLQLQQLVEKAPFDVGCDNIFSQANGDAIIIDTEFKGEGSTACLKKLQQRYFDRNEISK